MCNATGECVECTNDGHCDGAEFCNAAYGLCAATCEGAQDCPFDEMCDISSGFCVDCLDDPDCRDPEEPFCRDLECTAQP